MALTSNAAPVVPFVDLGLGHAQIRDDVLADIASLIDSGAFTNGPAVRSFERAFAAFCGTRLSVGLASGLDALRLALVAAELRPDEEVIVPANTFIATLEAVTQAGGRPVVVDVSEDDWNIDPVQADAAVSGRTRFLVPVHLYGQMADMRAIGRVARRLGVEVLEDACQAHGAERDGLRAGAVGRAAAFSFYPGKNLGAMGDAGALVTNDDRLANRVAALREHGQVGKYRHELVGYTARLDTIQAVVLLHKLPLLDSWNDARRAAASYYADALAEVGDLGLPPVPRGSRPVWHLYVVRTSRRDDLAAWLAGRGVATGLHYPQPVHLSGAYAHLGYGRGAFPVAEALADELLSLPIYPGIEERQLEVVVSGVRAFFKRG